MKTNKTYSKRLRVTRTGKILSRQKGGDHYNAKESRKTQLNRKRQVKVVMTNKAVRRYLPRTK
jgi:ribosomal protein L35